MKWGLPLSNLGDMTNVQNRTATDKGFHSEFFDFFIYGFFLGGHGSHEEVTAE